MRRRTIVILLPAALSWIAACQNMGDLNPITLTDRPTTLERTCLADGGEILREEIMAMYPASVDILVVVDNSGSMAAEQVMLRDAFTTLIASLLTGEEPVHDLHVGVVSTDMGVGGYNVATCESDPLYGDDGVLQHEPHAADCSADYPAYLDYSVDPDSEPDPTRIETLAADFGCLAVLGTFGCGFEQQLEAARKALVEHAEPWGANAGFLRKHSTLLVLFVTDEEDCSAADTTLFDISGLHYSTNLQCYYERGKLRSVNEYQDAFLELRPSSNRLAFGFIVGVPPDEIACNGPGSEIMGCNETLAMREVVRPDGELLEYVCRYPPECTPPDPPYPGDCRSEAFPARRFVQMAKAFPETAVVQSICRESFMPIMEALVRTVQESFTIHRPEDQPRATADSTEPSLLSADCEVVEELSDNRVCPEDKPAYDRDGDTEIDYEYVRNTDTGDYEQHSLCLVQQAGADCTGEDGGCVKAPGKDGWWFDPGRGVFDFTGLAAEPDSPGVEILCCK
jgi:hypothetical protein